MAVGTGIGFDISQLDAAIKSADEALKTLGKTGKSAAKQLDEAFALAKSGNIQDFISVIDRLSNSLGKKGYNQAAQMVREIASETTGAIDRVNRFASLMQTISEGGRSYVKNGAIENLKYQLDEALSRLGVLNERLQFYTKGEGAKAVNANVVDTSALQDEANKLRVVVELLQRRLEHEQALAALKQRSGAIENQQALNASWQKMEEERVKQLQQQSINAKEANKAYEQAYNDRYQMYAVMYDKMWQEDLKHFERQNANAKSGGQQYAKDYEERTRYYERWINEEFLKEQEKNKRIAESKLAEERRINQQISQDRIDQLGRESQQRQKIEQMIRDTQKRNHDQRQKELEDLFREQERQAKAQAKYDSASRRERYKAYTTSYEGAIRTSDRAKTVAQEIQAVKNLEAARAKLNKTEADYQKKLDDINARILQHNKNIAQATAGAKDLQKAHSKLGTTIASVFSIQAIRGYINQMIKVRGEMELQQRSLQAILQNKDAANEVWQKTIDLAVRSPFRIKDLVTYTKQLAAYRVESEKLYNTNKMLADVSAGLGVDMQRLILAFGQVKSANFLRGTELRQFTEAGIPMLDELAKLYTQMEGALVTSGDVFERISKRMVLFEDVEEVFKRMTAAGGTFYRMQEIQSETLKGQISNLKDSVDIMLNSMGKDMDGVLKKSVKSVKFLVDNYEVLIPILKGIIVALALYKVNSFAASEATLRMARSMKMAKISATGLGGAWTSLRVGLAQFGKDLGKITKMLASNPWLLLAAAIVTAAIKLNQFRKELEEVDKKYSQLLDKQGDVYLAFRQAGQKGDLEEQVAERRKQLQALVDMAKNEYGLIVDINVGEIDESKLENEFNKIRQKMIELNAFSASFSKEMIKSDKLSKWYGEDSFGLEEGLFEDIQDLGGSYEKLSQEMINRAGRTVETLRDKWDDLTDAQQKAVEDLEKPIQGDESLVDYVNRLKDAYTTLLELKDVKNNKISRFIRSFNRDVREANVEFKLFANRFREEVNNIADEKEKVEFLDVSIGAMADEKKWSEFEENYIRRLVEQEFGITFVPKTATSEELKSWQKSYNALFEGESGFREITATATSQSQVIERLKGTYESLEGTIKRIEAVGKDSVLAGGAYEGQDLNKLKSDLAGVKRQLDWFGAEVKKGGSGGKDEVLEKLKNRINLVKEMNKEYEKLNKTFSKAESLAKVQKAYADTAKELGLDTSTMDFTDEGTIKSLEALLGKPEYAANKYVIELQKALDNFKVELGIEVKQEQDKDLKAQVQELFDQYDLSLELKKLNIPPELAKSLFDVDYLDLDGLKKAVQAQEAKFVGKDMVDEYKKFLEKIDDMEDKAAKERMKTYVKYLQKGMSERVKLKIEELRKLKEIEESAEFIPEQKERIKAGVSKEARAERQKQEWKDFQGTEMYTMMFEDLEHYGTAAIDMLYTKLSELKTSLSDLPASEVKEIVGQIEKLENIKIERNPFESLKKYKDEVKNIGFTEDELQTQLLDSQKAEEDAQKYIDIYNTVMQSLMSEDEGVFEEIDAETLSQWNQMLRLAEEQGKTVEDILADRKETVETEQENQGKIVKNLNSYKKLSKAQKESLELTQEWLAQVGNLFSASKDLMESLGVESDSVAMTIADTGSSMVSLIQSAIQFTLQLQLMGIAANSALGIIGWIAIALQAVAMVISAIFSAKDKALQKEIDGHLARAEKLHEKYEELSDAIDSAYDASVVRQLNKEIEKTIQLEIKAIEAAIAAEKSQKDSKIDWGWVDEQEKKVKELYNTLNEEHDNYIERWGGFGSDEARLDFIESMTQAWLDSFKETGDGLDGLEEKWDEYFDNLAMKQMVLRVSKAAIDKYLDMWDKYVSAESAGGEDLTEAEAQDLRLKKEQLLKGLSEKYISLAESLGITPTTEGGGLSALTKGIQGVSESTAQVLEALLNSMRFYVADSNAKLTQLLNNMMGGETESPMLAELRAQTKWMRDIYNLINGMTATHPSGGRGIKTVM